MRIPHSRSCACSAAPILLCAIAAVALTGCQRPERMWRDQFVFIADDGAVMSFGVLRWSSGRAEAKGWAGEAGEWRSNYFTPFSIGRSAGPDVELALSALSRNRGARARVSLTRRDRDVELRLRTPSESFRLAARDLSELGSSVDPEGVSRYRAGRARWSGGGRSRYGWLVVEETPSEAPREPFVAYGDFVFLVAADRELGVIVAKRSADVPGFDHAFMGVPGQARETRQVEVSRSAADLGVILGADAERRLSIMDSLVTHGAGPGGTDLAYEALLLGGEYAGVAFTIRPASAMREGTR